MADIWDSFNDFILDFAVVDDRDASQDSRVDFDLDDSSDSDDGLTQVAIVDSFSSDAVDDSVVAGGGIEDSFGTDIDAGIDDSFYDIDQTGLANVDLDDTLDLEIGGMLGNNDIDLL